MGRPRGQREKRAGTFIGWWRPHRYADWQQRARGDNWRETWLALVDAVGELREDDSTDLAILEVGKTPTDGDAPHAT
jgi:hypothetical protein